MIFKRAYRVVLGRPTEDHRIVEYKTVEVQARTKQKAIYLALVTTPGLWFFSRWAS